MKPIESHDRIRIKTGFAVLLVSLLSLLTACADPLVEDRYVKLGGKSINGIDAFMKLLEEEVVAERGGELLRSNSLTNRVRGRADLVVYFEREFLEGHEATEYYRNLEAFLFGYDPEDLRVSESLDEEFELPDQENESPLEDSAEPIEIRIDSPKETLRERFTTGRTLRYSLQEDSGQTSPDEFSEIADEETLDEFAEDSLADANLPEETIDRYKTILYFLKDTDTTVAFWQQLTEQMRDHPEQHAYCAEQLAVAIKSRSYDVLSYLVPLSSRRTVYEVGELVDRLQWNRAVFPESDFPAGGLRYPVRTVPGSVRSQFGVTEAEGLTGRTLLATADGEDLIRELELPFARLILVYNSESFLNHSQVHSRNRLLARTLIRHGLLDYTQNSDEPPVAALVRTLIKTETAAKEDFDMLRLLKVFPLNVIVIHFLVLLALFLLSRWPHSGPPLENQKAGNREFLEHIRALGVRLSRTTPRMKALEALLRYKQKSTGRDYTAVIEKLGEASGARPDEPLEKKEQEKDR